MRRRVKWAPSARTDLREIIDYIWADRRDAAIEVRDWVLASARGLSEHAERGKIVPEFLAEGERQFRQVLVGPYRIVYRLKVKTVEIVLIVDSRRDLPNVFAEWILREE